MLHVGAKCGLARDLPGISTGNSLVMRESWQDYRGYPSLLVVCAYGAVLVIYISTEQTHARAVSLSPL